MAELEGHFVSVITATPSEGRNSKHFECPLCVEVFQEFSQLQEHLLSMHPRRQMIMKLVTERYGISKRDAETQRTQELSANCENTVEKSLPTVSGTGTSAHVFKVPHKLRHKAAALPRIQNHQCEKTSREFSCVQKTSQRAERSSWESYLEFCLSNSVSKDPVHGDL